MFIPACCVDPLNPAGRPTPANLALYGFRGVRSVFEARPEWHSYHLAAKRAGLVTIVTLARESFPGSRPDTINNLPTDADWVVIANEPDGEGESSWRQSQAEFLALVAECSALVRQRCPAAKIVAGGLVSGQPDWLRPIMRDLRPLVDAIDVHPYNKTASEARALLQGYSARTGGLPLVVLEWNRPPDQVDGFLRMLAQTTQAGAFFCWSDGMVNGFGLVDPRGNAKHELDALQAGMLALPPDQPLPPAPPAEAYVVGPGIAKRMEQFGTTPATDEDYRPRPEKWTYSEAYGKDARRYVYLRATRQILTYDPTHWIDEDELLNPKPKPDGPWRWFSADQIAQVVGAPLSSVQVNWPALSAALDEAGAGERPTAIAAIATVGVEVSAFGPINEYGDDAYFERMYGPGTTVGQQLGNVNPGDGARYHGRGFIQLTGRGNYRRYGQRLGVDLEGNPDLALDPQTSARVLATYFVDHGIPARAAARNWISVRKAVNGGVNGWDRFAKLVDALEAIPDP